MYYTNGDDPGTIVITYFYTKRIEGSVELLAKQYMFPKSNAGLHSLPPIPRKGSANKSNGIHYEEQSILPNPEIDRDSLGVVT